MNVKYAQVIFGDNEYSNFKIGADKIRRAIAMYGVPIKLINRGKRIYLMRTDI